MQQLLQPCNPEERGRTEMLIQVSRARKSSDPMSEAPKAAIQMYGQLLVHDAVIRQHVSILSRSILRRCDYAVERMWLCWTV